MNELHNILQVVKKVREREKVLYNKMKKYQMLENRVCRLADMLGDAFRTDPQYIDNVSDDVRKHIYEVLVDVKDLEDCEIDEYCFRQYSQINWLYSELCEANKEETK